MAMSLKPCSCTRLSFNEYVNVTNCAATQSVERKKQDNIETINYHSHQLLNAYESRKQYRPCNCLRTWGLTTVAILRIQDQNIRFIAKFENVFTFSNVISPHESCKLGNHMPLHICMSWGCGSVTSDMFWSNNLIFSLRKDVSSEINLQLKVNQEVRSTGETVINGACTNNSRFKHFLDLKAWIWHPPVGLPMFELRLVLTLTVVSIRGCCSELICCTICTERLVPPLKFVFPDPAKKCRSSTDPLTFLEWVKTQSKALPLHVGKTLQLTLVVNTRCKSRICVYFHLFSSEFLIRVLPVDEVWHISTRWAGGVGAIHARLDKSCVWARAAAFKLSLQLKQTTAFSLCIKRSWVTSLCCYAFGTITRWVIIKTRFKMWWTSCEEPIWS